MLNDFFKILKNDQVRHFLEKGIEVCYDETYPFCSYIGFNYSRQELLNIKFYISTFKKVELSRIKEFFPHTDEIEAAYNKFKEAREFSLHNTGAMFALKIDKHGKITYSFYVRLNDWETPPPKKITLLQKEYKEDYTEGYVIEIKDGKVYQKNYHLLRDTLNVSYFLQHFGIKNVDKSKVYAIEHVEFLEKAKFVMVIPDRDYLSDYLKQQQNNHFDTLNEFLQQELGLTANLPGIYPSSEERSIYYMDKSLSLVNLGNLLVAQKILKFVQNNVQPVFLSSPYPKDIQTLLMREIYIDKIYDFDTANNHPVIIDCGANVGYSIAYFKSKYPDAKIYAFEPDKLTYDVLIENIKENGFTNVLTENKAVGDVDGTVDFYALGENKFNAPLMSFFTNELADKKTHVESIAFGEFLKQFDEVDFCKVDIEGGESVVLKSLIECGTLSKIKEFVFEYHHWVKQKYDFAEFVQIFETNNFECITIKEDPPHKGWSTSGNTIVKFKNKLYQ